MPDFALVLYYFLLKHSCYQSNKEYLFTVLRLFAAASVMLLDGWDVRGRQVE